MPESALSYHIRWSAAKLDWEAFHTKDEAEYQAKELARPGENFTVEQFDGDCPRCASFRKVAGATPLPPRTAGNV
jgi:hypothetical protein